MASARLRQRVVARQRDGLAQHRAVADVVGQDQHQLGRQHLGLLVAQAALAFDQLVVEGVGVGMAGPTVIDDGDDEEEVPRTVVAASNGRSTR